MEKERKKKASNHCLITTVHVFGFRCVTKKFVLEYFAASAAAYLMPIVTNAIAPCSFVHIFNSNGTKRKERQGIKGTSHCVYALLLRCNVYIVNRDSIHMH